MRPARHARWETNVVLPGPSLLRTSRVTTGRQRAHLERLWAELRHTPCSERCANWLLYGIQPKKAKQGLRPGNCKNKVHKRETLGIGGRRVLISRQWSGKTLADHRADRKEWVKALLGVTTDAGTAPDRLRHCAARLGTRQTHRPRRPISRSPGAAGHLRAHPMAGAAGRRET
ncbi:replication initiator [Micromonospora sp. 15K316]|uniref:replication initiator n=1 Tax=Micromonospora sp. 15K316 TaxID=2530376 RepID=UPI00352E4D51